VGQVKAIARGFEQKTGSNSANIRATKSDMPDLFGAKVAEADKGFEGTKTAAAHGKQPALTNSDNSPIQCCGGEKSEAVKGGTKKPFTYIHNPSHNPKVLKDAEKDATAVYGYKPNRTGSFREFASLGWSNKEVVAGCHENRRQYHEENKK